MNVNMSKTVVDKSTNIDTSIYAREMMLFATMISSGTQTVACWATPMPSMVAVPLSVMPSK